MATDSARLTISARTLSTGLFVGLLLLSFLNNVPFAERAAIEDAAANEGSLLRQIAFVITGAVLLSIAWTRGTHSFARTIGPWIVVSFAWCFVTLTWSSAPDVGVRRLVLTVVATISVFASVRVLGPTQSFRLFAGFLSVTVVLSLLAGLFVAAGRHQWGDPESGLIGAWRGVFFHKNQAGFAAAMSILASWFMFKLSGRRVWLVLSVLAVVLLGLSRSKTSIGLLIPSVAIGALMGWASANGRSRFAVVGLLFGAFLVVAVSVASLSNVFQNVVESPDAFTGRGAVWAALIQMISDRPILGFGYGSIFGAGATSVWFDYATGWAVFVAHGHNGYLDVWAATGLVGLLAAVMAFVVDPVRSLASASSSNSHWVGLIATTFAFVLLHNTMESSLLDRARPEWITLVLGCAIARCMPRRQK